MFNQRDPHDYRYEVKGSEPADLLEVICALISLRCCWENNSGKKPDQRSMGRKRKSDMIIVSATLIQSPHDYDCRCGFSRIQVPVRLKPHLQSLAGTMIKAGKSIILYCVPGIFSGYFRAVTPRGGDCVSGRPSLNISLSCGAAASAVATGDIRHGKARSRCARVRLHNPVGFSLREP